MRNRRGPVVWKQDVAVTGDKPARTREHQREADLPPELKEAFEEALVPGSLFGTLIDLEVQQLAKGVTPPPYPVLQQHYPRSWDSTYVREKSCIPSGALAMYTGTIRVEEEGRQGKLRVVRHTFIVGGGRFMIPNLNWLKPV